MAIAILVVGFRLVFPLVVVAFRGSDFPYATLYLVLEAGYQLLLVAPLVLWRHRVGWVHPLVLPVLWSALKDVAGSGSLLYASPVLHSIQTLQFANPPLAGVGSDAIGQAFIADRGLHILAVIAYYIGFWLFKAPSTFRLAPSSGGRVRKWMVVAAIVSAVVGVGFIVIQGGVGALIAYWGAGRFVTLSMYGPILVVIKMGGFILLVYYTFSDKGFIDPVFWFMVAVLLPLSFVVSGSRSGVIYPALLLLIASIIRHRRLPVVRGGVLAATAFVLFGVLGLVRTSAWGGDADTVASSIESIDFENALIRASDEANVRELQKGSVVVANHVLSGAPLLWGESYVSVIGLAIPRSIWTSKPRGIGAIYVERVYGYGSGSYSIPVGAVGEAVWNFHIPGLFAIFIAFGIAMRWIEKMYIENYNIKSFVCIYIPTVFYAAPSSDGLVPLLHILIFIGFFLWIAGALKKVSARPGYSRRPPNLGKSALSQTL